MNKQNIPNSKDTFFFSSPSLFDFCFCFITNPARSNPSYNKTLDPLQEKYTLIAARPFLRPWSPRRTPTTGSVNGVGLLVRTLGRGHLWRTIRLWSQCPWFPSNGNYPAACSR